MLQIIGTMMVAYIITRMTELVLNPKPNGESLQRIFAMLTIIVALVSIMLLSVNAKYMMENMCGL